MCDDRNWVEELRSDSPNSAIHDLSRILQRGLMRSFGERGADHAFVEDVIQESILKVIKGLDSFAGRSRFTTWAITIATRVGISKLRRQKFKEYSLEQVSADGDLKIHVALDESPDVARDSEHRELVIQLKGLIDTALTDRQRRVIHAVLSGVPIEEIAVRMNSNRNAVYKLFHDARKKLRAGFESLGVFASDIQTTT